MELFRGFFWVSLLCTRGDFWKLLPSSDLFLYLHVMLSKIYKDSRVGKSRTERVLVERSIFNGIFVIALEVFRRMLLMVLDRWMSMYRGRPKKRDNRPKLNDISSS